MTVTVVTGVGSPSCWTASRSFPSASRQTMVGSAVSRYSHPPATTASATAGEPARHGAARARRPRSVAPNAIPNAEFVLLTEAGHMPQLETPERLLPAVWDFAHAHARNHPPR